MYVPCMLYRATNAKYIYTYINNILHTVSSPTCFNASALSFGSPKVIKLLQLQFHVIIINILQTVFYHSTPDEHFNVLILLSCNFNNVVHLAQHKVKTV